jgi:hypothetical protein
LDSEKLDVPADWLTLAARGRSEDGDDHGVAASNGADDCSDNTCRPIMILAETIRDLFTRIHPLLDPTAIA